MSSERDNGGVIELADVKAGDFVALSVSHGWRKWVTQKAQVTSTTSSRIMLGEQAFNWNGRAVASGHALPSIEPWREDVHPMQIAQEQAEHELNAMRRRLSDYAWRDISKERADEVFAALGLTVKDSA